MKISRSDAVKRIIREAVVKTVHLHCHGCDEYECDDDGPDALKRDAAYIESIVSEVFESLERENV